MTTHERTPIELDLTALAPTGEALGRADGRVVFVPLALPGERVEAVVVEEGRRFARGKLLRVLRPAPERIRPLCRHFGVCGGCDWQHIDYQAQVQFKQAALREQLIRFGQFADPPLLPPTPSPKAYAYRSRARLLLDAAGRFGYRAARSHEIVPVIECPILEPALAAALQKGPLPTAEGGDREWMLSAPPPLRVGEHNYEVSPGAFFQVNMAVAALLVAEVLQMLDLRGGERVIDLYCGVGLFTLPISARAAEVLAVEANPIAAADAERNLAPLRMQGAQIQLVNQRVEDALRSRHILGDRRPDTIVLDPPRAGVEAAALRTIGSLRAAKIVYVACDPATLARDLRLLIDAGYRLLSVQAFDMFPQTHHVEALALLERSGAGQRRR